MEASRSHLLFSYKTLSKADGRDGTVRLVQKFFNKCCLDGERVVLDARNTAILIRFVADMPMTNEHTVAAMNHAIGVMVGLHEVAVSIEDDGNGFADAVSAVFDDMLECLTYIQRAITVLMLDEMVDPYDLDDRMGAINDAARRGLAELKSLKT